MSYQPKTYRKDGGDTFVVASGGEVLVESGGSITLESGSSMTVESGGALYDAGAVRNVRVRATAAQVNASGGYAVLAGVTGKKVRMVDCKMIAIGGAASGATGVQVKCGTTVLVDAKAAALTQSTVCRAGDSNVNVLADGASFVAQTAGDGVTVVKDGSNLATATHVDVIFDYVLE